MKRYGIAVLVCGILALTPGAARAQIYAPPQVVQPYPPPTTVYYAMPAQGGNLLVPVATPATQYNFNGPSTGTVGWKTTISYYSDPNCPTQGRQVITGYTPVMGYQPGYYSGYYTPLFYRP